MSTKTFLSTVKFAELLNWDVKSYKRAKLNSNFELVELSKILIHQNKKIKLEKNKIHSILGVNNVSGIFDAYTISGDKINQPYQEMRNGWLAYNPYRINVGSIGIKLEEHKNNYISPAYVIFSCNENLSPHYFFYLFKTDKFNTIIRDNTTGSVRQNLSFKNLSNIKIPLPPLEEQKRLVEAYNQKIKEAEQAEEKSNRLETEIENYIYSELGIQKQKKQEKTKGLQFVRFSQLKNRWDAPSIDKSSSSNYPLIQLSEAFTFVSRSWKERNNDTFRYVELGNIDPLVGITGYSELKVNKAPSRATQIIKKGDLIIGTTRPYLKRFAIVNHEYNNCIASSGFQIIEDNGMNNLVFLLQVLHSDFVIQQFQKYMTGALYPAITVKNLQKIQIPLPPLFKQNEIVEHITALKEQIKTLRNQAQLNRQQAIRDFENTIFS